MQQYVYAMGDSYERTVQYVIIRHEGNKSLFEIDALHMNSF